MAVQLLQLAAATYLGACLVAGLGLALGSRSLERVSVWVLALGAVIHGVSFSLLHGGEGTTPPLTDLSTAFSYMAWVGTVFFLLLLRRARLHRLVALVAPASFLGAFVAALRLPGIAPAPTGAGGSWPHAHVLLASAGLGLLAVAGLAGMMFLVEHRRLKAKRLIDPRMPLPSLEALDRVNAAALAVGFPLLTLGVITGMLWLRSVAGQVFSGTAHETWSLVAWAVYGVLVTARFAANQGSRQSAVSAVGGFAFLLFAVVGLEMLV